MSNIIHGYTKPISTDFTLLNSSAGSSVTDTCEGIHWYGANTSTGTRQNALLVQTAPSTPWKATAHMINTGGWAAEMRFGMVIRQSSNGYFQQWYNSSRTGDKIGNSIHLWVNWTDYSTAPSYAIINTAWGTEWFQFEDDGTNRYWRTSRDGINWTTNVTQSRTNFLTADQIGFTIDSYTQHAWVVIDHFKVEVA